MAERRRGLLNGRYELVKALSAGTFGQVYLAKDSRTNKDVAIKCIPLGKVTKYVESEIVNHRILFKHAHVVHFLEVFLTGQFLCMVMEYAPDGNMFDYVVKKKGGALKEEEAKWYFQQLIISVDYCHRMGVVNRDIKLENTLLSGQILKLCDFGYSKHKELESMPNTRVGTLTYIAPEVCQTGVPYEGNSADMWSCGIMLYVMLVGAYPFQHPQDGSDPMRAMQRVLKMDFRVPIERVPVSAECKDLLSRLLVREPRQRLTMQQVMEHPWFQAGLPKGALKMNDEYVRRARETKVGLQDCDDVKQVIATAMQQGKRAGRA